MYARHVALHLKPNTLSDFTKTFDTNVRVGLQVESYVASVHSQPPGIDR